MGEQAHDRLTLHSRCALDEPELAASLDRLEAPLKILVLGFAEDPAKQLCCLHAQPWLPRELYVRGRGWSQL